MGVDRGDALRCVADGEQHAGPTDDQQPPVHVEQRRQDLGEDPAAHDQRSGHRPAGPGDATHHRELDGLDRAEHVELAEDDVLALERQEHAGQRGERGGE